MANERSLDLIKASHLKAFTVVQDVRTGAILVFAASHPSELDVTSAVSPLSLVKLLLAASWWDNKQPDTRFPDTPNSSPAMSAHEMLVTGHDEPGRGMAIALCKAVGTKVVVEDFERYGFGPQPESQRDDKFWAELAAAWQARLLPAPAYVSLGDPTTDAEWAETLSLGESNMTVTALHISRFLQAVGNGGVMLTPVARENPASPLPNRSGKRVMQEATARQLQSAMRDCVQRGTAKSIAQTLQDSGWQIGGKTGSGPALLPKGPELDGWFAGLIFDPEGKARFTVATFVRSGGYGGGNAARISAELARYIIEKR